MLGLAARSDTAQRRTTLPPTNSAVKNFCVLVSEFQKSCMVLSTVEPSEGFIFAYALPEIEN